MLQIGDIRIHMINEHLSRLIPAAHLVLSRVYCGRRCFPPMKIILCR